jgi:hypothetical protein
MTVINLKRVFQIMNLLYTLKSNSNIIDNVRSEINVTWLNEAEKLFEI